MYPADEKGQESHIARQQIESAVSDYPAAFAATPDVKNYVVYSIDRRKLEAELKK
jgi:hypothetical protein